MSITLAICLIIVFANELPLQTAKNIIKQVTAVYRKIRNTARYILGNINDFDVDNPVAYEDLQEIDKWALTKLNKLIKD